MVVEDGTGLTDADALISADFADAYFLKRGNAVWGGHDAEKKSIAIILATDYFEAVYGPQLAHSKLTETQSLSLPTSIGMPPTILRVVAVIAGLQASGTALFQAHKTDSQGQVVLEQGPIVETTEKVDVITETVKYAAPQAGSSSGIEGGVLLFPQVEAAMAPFLRTLSSTGSQRTYR